MSEDLAWPQLPEGTSYIEVGRQEYVLFRDGTETLAWWEPGADGEMELVDVQVYPGQ